MDFSIVIKALKKLYDMNNITDNALKEMLNKKSISPDEYYFIVGKEEK